MATSTKSDRPNEPQKKRGRKPKVREPEEQQQIIKELANVSAPNDDEAVEVIRPSGIKRSYKTKGSPFVVDYDPADVKQALQINNYWRRRGLESRTTTNTELQNRLEEYLEWCETYGVKPLVETGSLAIGYSRITVYNWKNGTNCDSERQRIIQAFYDTLASFDAAMAVNNRINPVLYFFRAKNYYDMRDQQEVVLGQKNTLGDIVDVSEIEKKYEYLPEE